MPTTLTDNVQRLVRVGPRHPRFAFPRWYEDATGVRLELPVDSTDPFLLAVTVPDSGAPWSIPDNFPDELFYALAEATLTVGGVTPPGRAKVVLALEAAFGGVGTPQEGQQMVFGRIRVRIDGARPGGRYVVTHPYGTTSELRADGRGRVFETLDVGACPLGFADALDAPVAPFLRWTTGAARRPGEDEAPAGHLGDAVTPHTITGSPGGTNFFALEGPRVADGGSPVDPAQPNNRDRIRTDLFTVHGRLARVLGTEVVEAVRTHPAGGSPVVDVVATAVDGQRLRARGPDPLAADLPLTDLRGDRRVRHARIAEGARRAASVEVLDLGGGLGPGGTPSDPAPEPATGPVTDAVLVTRAEYDLATSTLTVTGASSDAVVAPGLTVVDVGRMTGPTTAFPLTAPPAAVTVRSDGGGSTLHAVTVVGPADAPVPPVAVPGPARTVEQGQAVVLDGQASTGAITGFAWTGPAGVVLAGASTARATFTATAPAGPLIFTLTVAGADGTTDSAPVTVTVAAPSAAVADAGGDVTVDVGDPVAVDGSGSRGAARFRWRSDAAAPIPGLDGATTPRATFTMPPGGPVVATLSVIGPGVPGGAVDTVTVTGRAYGLRIDSALYLADKLSVRVRGTADGPAPDRVTVTLGGRSLGGVGVDATGAWDLVADLPDELGVPLDGDPVVAVSRRGGTAGRPLTVK